MSTKANWRMGHTTALFVILIAIIIIGIFLGGRFHLFSWISIVILLFLFSLIASHGITGLWRGLFIDARNQISLSRFQLVFWTIIIISAFMSIALKNLGSGWVNPLNIGIPSEVWVLLGISTTTMVGSPLLKSTKAREKEDPYETAKTLDILYERGENPKEFSNIGKILIRTKPEFARWSDMFRAEETGNGGHLDIGKIQLFYFTIIILLAYSIAIGSLLTLNDTRIEALPDLDSSIIALLGISHAGYLTNKGVRQSESPK